MTAITSATKEAHPSTVGATATCSDSAKNEARISDFAESKDCGLRRSYTLRHVSAPSLKRAAIGGACGAAPLSLSNGHNCAERGRDKVVLTGSQRKTAHAIRVNCERMAEEYGVGRLAFWTLTAGDEGPDGFELLKDAAKAAKRWHGLSRRFVGEIFLRAVVVTERGKKGGVHFHVLGVLREALDIRTGFNFEAVKKRDYRSASPELRAIWKKCREELPAFGFGRAEMLPVRKTGAEVASYISKYIEKNIGARTEEDKGKKLVRYFGWGKRHLKPNDFSWCTERATAWRVSARGLSALVGVESRAEAAECFGPRWAFHLSRVMNATAGSSEVECSQELSSFETRSTALQFVLRAANQKWVECRSRRNARDVRGWKWTWNYKTPSERAHLELL